jgi:hypothetical protein
MCGNATRIVEKITGWSRSSRDQLASRHGRAEGATLRGPLDKSTQHSTAWGCALTKTGGRAGNEPILKKQNACHPPAARFSALSKCTAAPDIRVPIMDIAQIENDLRRILNSRKSIVERTKMADKLCQKVNEYHTLLQDEDAKVRFRKDYKALIEAKLPAAMARTTSRSRVLNQMIDHAKNLEKVEAIGEKLNRELGDF